MRIVHSSFIIFFIIQRQVYCLTKGEKGVCYNKTAIQNVCCGSYEEVKGKCVSCLTGFISKQGGPCLPCGEMFYGDRCLLRCECSDSEWCHQKFGCMALTTANDENDRTSSQMTIEVKSTAIGITIRYPEDKIQFSGTNKFEWKIFTVIITVIVVFPWIGFFAYKCIKRHKQRVANISAQINPIDRPIEEIEDEPQEEGQDVSYVLSGDHYYSIDETQMVDLNAKNNPYLDVIDGSSSSGSTVSDNHNDDSTSYLNPYNPLITTSEVHTYKEIKNVNEKTDSNTDMDGYLVPQAYKEKPKDQMFDKSHVIEKSQSDSNVIRNKTLENDFKSFQNDTTSRSESNLVKIETHLKNNIKQNSL